MYFCGEKYCLWIGSGFRYFQDWCDAPKLFLKLLSKSEKKRVWKVIQRKIKKDIDIKQEQKAIEAKKSRSKIIQAIKECAWEIKDKSPNEEKYTTAYSGTILKKEHEHGNFIHLSGTDKK